MPITAKAYVKHLGFTDPAAIWPNKEEANAWHDAQYVDMATVCNPGVVRLATGVVNVPVTIDGNYYTVTIADPDAGLIAAGLVSKERYDTLEADHLALRTSYEALLATLINAGILSNDPNETCV